MEQSKNFDQGIDILYSNSQAEEIVLRKLIVGIQVRSPHIQATLADLVIEQQIQWGILEQYQSITQVNHRLIRYKTRVLLVFIQI